MAEITTLIDKQDNNEIVRDQIAAILSIEKTNQIQLATDAGKPNPLLWDFDVFIERAKPWESLSKSDGSEDGELKNGLVNVYFESDNFDSPGSDNIQTQKVRGTFFIDCYGQKSAVDTAGVISAGDELSSYEVDRIARLVRNILMAGQYTYLGFDRGQIVTKRFIIRREKFFPDQRQDGFENVIGERLTLNVEYIETSPQAVLEILNTLITQCTRSSDGKILFEYQAT
jgi:hypothetical protein